MTEIEAIDQVWVFLPINMEYLSIYSLISFISLVVFILHRTWYILVDLYLHFHFGGAYVNGIVLLIQILFVPGWYIGNQQTFVWQPCILQPWYNHLLILVFYLFLWIFHIDDVIYEKGNFYFFLSNLHTFISISISWHTALARTFSIMLEGVASGDILALYLDLSGKSLSFSSVWC